MKRVRVIPGEKEFLTLLEKFFQVQSADAWFLYSYYYALAKAQHTNTPKSTVEAAAIKLGWTLDRVRKNKNILKGMGLLEDFGKMSCFFRLNTTVSTPEGTTVSTNDGMEKTVVSTHDGIGLENDKTPVSTHDGICPLYIIRGDEPKVPSPNRPISPNQFDDFWKLYPRKGTNKPDAHIAWVNLCKKKDRPTWKQVKKALLEHSKSKRWLDPEFIIPNASTWLNGHRWEVDAKDMTKIIRKGSSNKPQSIFDDGIQYDLGSDGRYYHCVTGQLYIP